MRTDVKVGIVLSMGLVLVVGGYFLFRTGPGEQAQLGNATAAVPEKPAAAPAPKTQPRNMRPDGSRPGTADATRPPRVNPRPNTAMPDPNRMAGTTSPNQPIGNAAPLPTDGSSPAQPNVGAPSTGTASGDDAARLASRGFTLPTDLAKNSAETPVRKDAAVTEILGPATTASPTGSVITAENPSSAPAHTARRDTAGARETHRAQPGDTLVSLAQAYYGSAAYLPLLRDANPQISDPTRLTAGMTIVIPSVPAGWQPQSTASAPVRPAGLGREPAQPSNSSRSPTANVPAGSDAKRTYTVKAGDSFYRIAEQQLGNASRWKELLTLNTKLVNGDPMRLRPGQVVVLPGS